MRTCQQLLAVSLDRGGLLSLRCLSSTPLPVAGPHSRCLVAICLCELRNRSLPCRPSPSFLLKKKIVRRLDGGTTHQSSENLRSVSSQGLRAGDTLSAAGELVRESMRSFHAFVRRREICVRTSMGSVWRSSPPCAGLDRMQAQRSIACFAPAIRRFTSLLCALQQWMRAA